MTFRDFLRAIKRGWVLFAAVLLLGVLVGSLATLTTPASYKASAKVFVSTGSATSLSDLTQGGDFAQQVVKSYADVATTPLVLDEVISSLGLRTTPDLLAEHISVSAPLDTVVIEITTTYSSPDLAAGISNSVAERLAAAVSVLTPRTQMQSAPVKITQIQVAVPPMFKAGPSLVLNVGTGLVLAGAVGVALVVGRARIDNRAHNAAEVHGMSGLPLLGMVGRDAAMRDEPLVVSRAPSSRRAEEFRKIRTNLQFLKLEGGRRSIVITSSIASEGKSTTAVNLALALADAGAKVCLVDADLRRPRVSDVFGLDGGVGLVDLLIDKSTFEVAAQEWGNGGLVVLPAGQIPPNPSELLQSNSMEVLLGRISAEFDYVIIDAPPLLPVPDASILAGRAAGAVLVAAAGRVREPQLRGAVDALEAVGARAFGVVVTMVPDKIGVAYGYATYGYGSPSLA